MNPFKKNIKAIKILSIILVSISIAFGITKIPNIKSEPQAKIKKITNTLLPKKKPVNKAYLNAQKTWVDGKLAAMTIDEKIGQLYMVPAYSNLGENHYKTVDNLINKYHVGGIIFFQGEPVSQVTLTNRFQKQSKIPLMVGIDGEWGLSMRLKNTKTFPKQITLGALANNDLIEEMGAEIGRECKRMGININFAPVVDINTNPKNPVINYRSFGESKLKVADKAAAFAKGMQSQNVMACAKHFPGHGDTGSDSHYSLPVVKYDIDRLNNIEIYPFKEMIADSIAAIMTGHLYVPALVSKPNTPASVSSEIINDLLRRDLGFTGLTLTDAMNMQGLTKYYARGKADLAAFKAGNDILLLSADVPAGYAAIKNALETGEISESELDEKVSRILSAKYWAGLNKPFQEISTANLIQDLNSPQADELIDKIYQEAATIVKNEEGLIPIINLDTCSFVSLSIGEASNSNFEYYLSKYRKFSNLTLKQKPTTSSQWSSVVSSIPKNSQVIISIHGLNNTPSKNYGVTNSTVDCIRAISKKAKVIIAVFGNPYSIKAFDEFPNVICGYEDTNGAHLGVSELIFGVFSSSAKMPVTSQLNIRPDYGFPAYSKQLGRLVEGTPESVGMNSNVLTQIDYVVQEGINAHAFPGCQVLVSRKGKVVFNKSYGYYTYDKTQPVTENTIYDLASITKVASTLQAVMMLNEKGWLDLNARVAEYIPELYNTNKENITVGELLLHEGGLKAFVPFWAFTKEGGNFRGDYYSFQPRDGYLQVADNLYVSDKIKDDVLHWIINSEMTTRRYRDGGFKYNYSDLGLILMQQVVERITNQPLDEFVDENLYQPLGMTTTGYNPLEKFDKSQIAPTEMDNYFRQRQLQGTVHDPNAALLGGVSGHAGLFSSAWDLAKLLQMNLQNGVYGGRTYLFPQTVKHFATNFSNKSHRGIGWNKPKADTDLSSVASDASLSTYGHTGYTGTVLWVDPDRELVFIMLSNRVYPSGNNRTLMKLETRKRIHEIINRSIIT